MLSILHKSMGKPLEFQALAHKFTLDSIGKVSKNEVKFTLCFHLFPNTLYLN